MQPDLIQAISEPRFDRYRRACNGDSSKALELYQFNAEIGASFWIDVMWLEVTLRNAIDYQLSLAFSKTWYSDVRFTKHLDSLHQRILNQTVASLLAKQTSQTKDSWSGTVISNLTFGFWVGLFSKSYTHSLWIPILRKVFQFEVKIDRKTAHLKFELIRRLRNRIAHHEPLFHLDLLHLNDAINELLKSLNPAVAELVKHNSQTKFKLMQLI